MNCYEAIDHMADALDGTLDGVKRSAFEEHLVECAPCHTYMGQLTDTVRSLGELSSSRAPGSNRSELLERFRQEMRGRRPTT